MTKGGGGQDVTKDRMGAGGMPILIKTGNFPEVWIAALILISFLSSSCTDLLKLSIVHKCLSLRNFHIA